MIVCCGSGRCGKQHSSVCCLDCVLLSVNRRTHLLPLRLPWNTVVLPSKVATPLLCLHQRLQAYLCKVFCHQTKVLFIGNTSAVKCSLISICVYEVLCAVAVLNLVQWMWWVNLFCFDCLDSQVYGLCLRTSLLLQFMEYLERHLYNAVEGCAVTMAPLPKVLLIFVSQLLMLQVDRKD